MGKVLRLYGIGRVFESRGGIITFYLFFKFTSFSKSFLSRVSILTRDIDIAILSVRPSVRYVPLSDENGLIYRHSFFTIR